MKKLVRAGLASVVALAMFLPVVHIAAVEHAAIPLHARDIEVLGQDGKMHKIDGSGTLIGIMDDGIDINSPGFKNLPKNPKIPGEDPSNPPKVILGRNWADDGKRPDYFGRDDDEPEYHGLHVAGIAAGNGLASSKNDAQPFQGIAPEAQIRFEKIQNSKGVQQVKDDVMQLALQTMVDNQVDVVNLSLGTDSSTMNIANTFREAIQAAVKKGVVIVSTAGNMGYVGHGVNEPLASNPDYGTIARPGLYPETICASSLDNDDVMKRPLFTAWGTSSDLVFKSDIATPSGKQVMSLGKEYDFDEDKIIDTLVEKHGTSMAAPMITGAVALVKQRLNVQYPELVANDAQTVALIKNLLLSTAKPVIDTDAKTADTYYSPRSIGNGLMQIKEACLSDCVAIAPLNVNDNETGYAKTNLRVLNGSTIEFDVELDNYALETHSFTPNLTLMVDSVADGHFTMHSENLVSHAALESGVISVPARQAGSREPGKALVHVAYTLDTATVEQLLKDRPNGFFVDGYVNFISNDANGIDLTHAFTGFLGDWFKAPIYDTFVYDLKDGQKPFYYASESEFSETKRTGDLNSTHLETLVDFNKRSIIGAYPDYSYDNMHVSEKHLAISPNNDGQADFINPVFTMLRNYQEIECDITDSQGETVFSGSYGVGNTDKHKNFGLDVSTAAHMQDTITESPSSLQWNGQNDEKTVTEGVYKYTLKVRPDYVNQRNAVAAAMAGDRDLKTFAFERSFDLIVDLTAPKLLKTNLIKTDNTGANAADPLVTVSFEIKDPNLGVSDIKGSGLYTAELVYGKQRQVLNFDIENPESVNQTQVTLKQSELENSSLILTDWARNSERYQPIIGAESQKVGNVHITSLDEDNKPITAYYMFENLETGKLYKNYGNLPVGSYAILPYNAKEGYNLIEADRKICEYIEIKEQAYNLTFHYAYDDYLVEINVGPGDLKEDDWDAVNTKDFAYVKEHDILLMLTDETTNQSYVLDVDKYGTYSCKGAAHIYKWKFLNTKPEDQMQVFDANRSPSDRLAIPKSAKHASFYYSAEGRNAGDVTTILPQLDNYVNDQSFMHVSANRDHKIGVDVFAKTDSELANPLLTISEDNHNCKIYRLPDQTDSIVSEFYLDLDEATMSQLKPGYLLRPYSIDKTGKKFFNEKIIAMVGPNHTLAIQKACYLEGIAKQQLAEQKIDQATHDKIMQQLADLKSIRDKVGIPIDKMSEALIQAKMGIPRNNYINLYAPDFSKSESGYTLSINELEAIINDVNQLVDTNLMAVLNELKLSEADIPVARVHLGAFTDVRTLIYPSWHDFYIFIELPTTAIVNDEASIQAASAYIYGKYDIDRDGQPLQPELHKTVALLPEFSQLFALNSWVKLDNSSTDDILEDSASGYKQIKVPAISLSIKPDLSMRYRLFVKTRDAKDANKGVAHVGIKILSADGKKEVCAEKLTRYKGNISFDGLVSGDYILEVTDTKPLGYAAKPGQYKMTILNDGSFEFAGASLKAGEAIVLTFEKDGSALPDPNDPAVKEPDEVNNSEPINKYLPGLIDKNDKTVLIEQSTALANDVTTNASKLPFRVVKTGEQAQTAWPLIGGSVLLLAALVILKKKSQQHC